jgi:hypothetical protein
MLFSNFVKLIKPDVHEIVVSKMLFLRGKRKLIVSLSKLKKEGRKSLSSFLTSNLEADVKLSGNKILVYDDSLSTKELKHLVNKFVYHKHLNHHYWVELEGNVVQLHNFKHAEKEKERAGTTPSTIKHGW